MRMAPEKCNIYAKFCNERDPCTYLVIVIDNDRFTYGLSHIIIIIMIFSLHLRSDYASSIAWMPCI